MGVVQQSSMPEMPYPGVDHGHTALIGGAYHLVITHATAGLNDARSTGIDHDIQTITKREKSVACDNRAAQ